MQGLARSGGRDVWLIIYACQNITAGNVQFSDLNLSSLLVFPLCWFQLQLWSFFIATASFTEISNLKILWLTILIERWYKNAEWREWFVQNKGLNYPLRCLKMTDMKNSKSQGVCHLNVMSIHYGIKFCWGYAGLFGSRIQS